MLVIIAIQPRAVFGLGQAVINEFTVEPEQKIEIWNKSSEIIDVSNWYLDDSGGTTYFTIPIGSVIAPGSCMVFSENINLNKSSADTIRFFDTTAPPTSTSAQLIDSFSYSKSPGGGVSWMRQNDAEDQWTTGSATIGYSNNSGVSCIVSPAATVTPTYQPTTVPELSPTEGHPANTECVELSEIMPYPASNELEWVELHNICTLEVKFDDWFIDDIKDGGSSPRKISMALPGSGFGSISIPTGMFNNSGDMVRLYDATESVIDSYEYDKAQQNMTLSRQANGTWCLTAATRDAPNNACEPTKIPVRVTPVTSISLNPTTSDTDAVQSIITINLNPQSFPEAPHHVLGTSDQQKTVIEKHSPSIQLIISYYLLAFASLITCIVKICYTFYYVRFSQTSVRPS